MSRLDPKCPKCGCDYVYMRYEGSRNRHYVKCNRCKYVWFERTLDDEEKSDD